MIHRMNTYAFEVQNLFSFIMWENAADNIQGKKQFAKCRCHKSKSIFITVYLYLCNANFSNRSNISMEMADTMITFSWSRKGSPSSVYDLKTLYGKINFELINAQKSCKCRNKLHLPLCPAVLVFSVQSEGKLCPF